MRLDYRVIADWIRPESSVLDLGCGDGELLSILVKEKHVRANGIEIDEQAIYKCVEKGLERLPRRHRGGALRATLTIRSTTSS